MLELGSSIGKLSKTAPIFSALGDPVRLAIITRLCQEGPLPTIELKQFVGDVSRQGLTKHLQILEGAGLVSSDRVGRDRQWQIQARQLEAMRDYLNLISTQWDLWLEQLRKFVEDDTD